eukprot:TRINITY_DN2822_c2_g2_i3.p1 TRINITY_DN2822_c2_g2~~TRINITY_DN2822_c2_g2_i3.p1  ORF type:complete len:358 (-),score=80.96 TRINITY_DN2822_c2_g2_i3:434-1507(-)
MKKRRCAVYTKPNPKPAMSSSKGTKRRIRPISQELDDDEGAYTSDSNDEMNDDERWGVVEKKAKTERTVLENWMGNHHNSFFFVSSVNQFDLIIQSVQDDFVDLTMEIRQSKDMKSMFITRMQSKDFMMEKVNLKEGDTLSEQFWDFPMVQGQNILLFAKDYHWRTDKGVDVISKMIERLIAGLNPDRIIFMVNGTRKEEFASLQKRLCSFSAGHQKIVDILKGIGDNGCRKVKRKYGKSKDIDDEEIENTLLLGSGELKVKKAVQALNHNLLFHGKGGKMSRKLRKYLEMMKCRNHHGNTAEIEIPVIRLGTDKDKVQNVARIVKESLWNRFRVVLFMARMLLNCVVVMNHLMQKF